MRIVNLRIALLGYMGSGKTQVRDVLVREQGFVPLSFAEPLKTFYSELVQRPIDKKIDRPALQSLGDGARNPQNSYLFDFTKEISFDERIYRLHRLIWPDDFLLKNLEKVEKAVINSPFLRGFGQENFWVNLLVARLLDVPLTSNIVIDDLRYINEAVVLREHGFRLIRLVVPLETVRKRLTRRDGRCEEKWFLHRSEEQHLSIREDFTVDNSRTLEETVKSIIDIVL